MIVPTLFAEAASSGSPLGALGVNGGAFLVQLITFIFVLLLLKKFAFTPIVKKLQERHKIIEDGVKLGQQMEAEKAKFQEDAAKVVRDARTEADRIIGDGQKEARAIVREAETAGKKKVDAMLVDAEARIDEESKQAKKRLEAEIAGLVTEATEAVVEEKMDKSHDDELVKRAVKGQSRS